jgi:penicillin-binding protein 1A
VNKAFRWIFRLALTGLVAGLLTMIVVYLIVAPDLPDVQTLRDVRMQVPLRVYTADRKLLQVYGEKRRKPVAIEDIPEDLKNAFIAGEDARFYEHPGVDYQGLTRAVITLATTGEKTIGGSTITQMLARNFFLTLDKTFTRKTKEIFLALRIERELSKDEILELFLNKILLGHRAYGVGAAAEVYYGKDLDELTLAQCAMIASLAKAPSRINPITSPERALERRNYVLNRMLELGYIDAAQYEQAAAERDNAYYHGAIVEVSAPHLAEMVRSEALSLLGREEAYTGGYEVITTIDSRLQNAASLAVLSGLEEYDHRHGYRGAEARTELPEESGTSTWDEILQAYGPVAGLVPGLVIESDPEIALVYLKSAQTIALSIEQMEWARPFISRDRVGARPKAVNEVLQTGDVIRARLYDDGVWRLAQIPEVESALVSIDPGDGAIHALVGGLDYSRSKFNRVTQSKRQPGSSFKPFIYSAALDKGYTTASLVNDAPIVFEDPELERTWKPQNFSEQFYGPTRLREAMVNSRNLVSIRLLRDLGIQSTREYISTFGFDPAELPANLSMALGSANLSPLAMARGYATFANGGYRINPYFIDRITDLSGQVVFQSEPARVCPECATESPLQGTLEPEADPLERPEYRPLALGGDAGEAATLPAPVTDLADSQHGLAESAITPQNAFLVRSTMMDVIKRGTGKRAMELGRSDLAGKTGTTNDQRDAWFSGFNDRLVTSVWVGFDSHEPLGQLEVGGRAALPVWIDFMRVALDGIPDTPPKMPEGLAAARINPQTGLLATLDNSEAVVELFEAGNLPPLEQSTDRVDPDATPEEDPYEIY